VAQRRRRQNKMNTVNDFITVAEHRSRLLRENPDGIARA
jgi:hypothetical protein